MRLSSGGPLITVDAVIETTGGPVLDCFWFDLTASTANQRAPLHPDSVELDDGKSLSFDAI